MMIDLDTDLDAASMFSFASAIGRRFQDNGGPGRQQESERRDENSIYTPSKSGPSGWPARPLAKIDPIKQVNKQAWMK
jgi:hypothetical protein